MNKNCPICQLPISSDDIITTCEECEGEFHLDCWNEYNGCATYGCKNAPKIKKQDSEQFIEHTYWGKKAKVCPICGEVIRIDILKCPYCDEEFDSAEPVIKEKFMANLAPQLKQSKGYKGAIIIFLSSLFGITAPVNLLFGGIWYQNNKKQLKEESPMQNLLAIIGLSISVFYLLFIFFAILF